MSPITNIWSQLTNSNPERPSNASTTYSHYAADYGDGRIVDYNQPKTNPTYILMAAIALVAVALGAYFGGTELNKYLDNTKEKTSASSNLSVDPEPLDTETSPPADAETSQPAGTPESGDEFSVSSARLRDIYETLAAADLESRWASTAAACQTDQNASLMALVRQMTDANDEVNATVQTQAEQVNRGRETLGNVLNELELAIPIAESLFFSGPAGPAMSYQFQLAVSGTAVDTGVDTTSETHDNAKENAARFDTLAQEYDGMFAKLTADFDPSPDPAVPAHA